MLICSPMVLQILASNSWLIVKCSLYILGIFFCNTIIIIIISARLADPYRLSSFGDAYRQVCVCGGGGGCVCVCDCWDVCGCVN